MFVIGLNISRNLGPLCNILNFEEGYKDKNGRKKVKESFEILQGTDIKDLYWLY